MHHHTKFFPIAMMTLSTSASIMYMFDRDWRQVIYWMAVTVITGSVTF